MKKILILMLALVMTMGMQAQTRKHTTARRAKTTHTTTKATVSNVNFAGHYYFTGSVYRTCGLLFNIDLEAVGNGKYQGTLSCVSGDPEMSEDELGYMGAVKFEVSGVAVGSSITLKIAGDAEVTITSDDYNEMADYSYTKGANVFKFTRKGSTMKAVPLGVMTKLMATWKEDLGEVEYTEK